MRKGTFNNTEKINGELATRRFSKDAYKYYSGTNPLTIYEVECESEKRYYVRGVIETDSLTFDELNEMFCELEKQVEECI